MEGKLDVGTAAPDVTKALHRRWSRVRGFLYRQFFYLPKSCPKRKLGLDEECILRLDRLIAASSSRSLQPLGLKLSLEPLNLLLAAECERFGSFSSEGRAVRRMLAERVPEDCLPC